MEELNDLNQGSGKTARYPGKTTTREAFDQKGNFTKQVFYNVAGVMTDSTVNKYDAKGVRTEQYFFSYGRGSAIIEKTGSNVYDENGNATIMKKKFINGFQTITCKYNSNGDDTEEEISEPDSNQNCKFLKSYQYNRREQKTEEIVLNLKSNIKTKTIYQYDTAGNKTEETVYDPDTVLKYKNTFLYDVNGNMIESSFYCSNGIGNFKNTYRYDDHNNCVEKIYCNADGTGLQKTSIKYEYDKEGNWVKKTEVIKSEKPVISTRHIEYY